VTTRPPSRTYADWRPTPPQIELAPEIALLSVLDRVLDVAVYTLLAVHPYLAADDLLYRQLHLPEVQAADHILAHAHRLRAALGCYRHAVVALYESAARDADPPPALDPLDDSDDHFPF